MDHMLPRNTGRYLTTKYTRNTKGYFVFLRYFVVHCTLQAEFPLAPDSSEND
jgi:hypothetical protein